MNKLIQEAIPQIIAESKSARLVSFDHKAPSNFAEFVRNSLELSAHVYLYDGPNDPRLQEAYETYLDKVSRFDGLCRVDESVQVVIEDSSVYLSPSWIGELTPNQDLRIEFFTEKHHLLGHRGPLEASITHFGVRTEHNPTTGETVQEIIPWSHKYLVEQEGDNRMKFVEVTDHSHPHSVILEFSQS